MQRHTLYNILVIGLILAAVGVVSAADPVTLSATNVSGDQVQSADPFMHPSPEVLKRWIDEYNMAPEAPQPSFLRRMMASFQTEQNLLSVISYNVTERNQNPIGNCWVWASTGVLEVALSEQQSIKDRLSIQYLDSNYNGGSGPNWAGEGGTLGDFVGFYSEKKIAVPWSNTNASFQDGTAYSEARMKAAVAAADIQTVPNYPITSITEQRIPTAGVGDSAAIANIKGTLDSGKALYLGFVMPNADAVVSFSNFWYYQGEDAVWNPSPFAGKPYDPSHGASHAVTIVGYNMTDPNNRYWIALNSMGAGASGNRPDGTFRIKMDIDYNAICPYVFTVPMTTWETEGVTFGEIPTPIPTLAPYNGSHQVPGVLQAEDYDLGGEGIAYHDTTTGNAGGAYRSDDVDIETAGGITDIGWIRDGEWLEYTLNVASSGSYTATFRTATWSNGKAITIQVDGQEVGTVQVPNTGGSEQYTSVSTTLPLTAGLRHLNLSFVGDGLNLDQVSFTTGQAVQVVPGATELPRDLNSDGLYEDLNGDGSLNFNDVVLFFNQMDWITENEPINTFDFNRDGQIDFNDIVLLFNQL
ncbi:carbohydrate-binding protein [Methanosphaerula palustris]|uniref:Carbohydrate binding family 6 n=1 Tax=Methanosphaerula palustris (strain ATCC BAA-1556 / DSM 19958 / E1-9c) TaxID=521011 RepID=B8GFQ2_METPE|nr:carbohydrate-binding protein [Methanosphaerula palustris]ACL17935.1 Carbohydrate binding family 6 [Methanosphaerula palustris E1-9c]